MQKFQDQGCNPCHSGNQNHKSDNARSLTFWATRELPELPWPCRIKSVFPLVSHFSSLTWSVTFYSTYLTYNFNYRTLLLKNYQSSIMTYYWIKCKTLLAILVRMGGSQGVLPCSGWAPPGHDFQHFRDAFPCKMGSEFISLSYGVIGGGWVKIKHSAGC